jgi:pimeloyl-ACP methyl ester carboxylesterase
VKIAIFEKWSPSEETKFRGNGKVILLVHGATWSSKCTFDPLPGYSLMDTLADAGFDVFALDLHGYGKSGKTDRDMTESPSAAEDIDAAVDYIRAFRWVEKVHVLGYQWGAQPAGIFAMKHPKKVGKLVLFGMRHSTTERSGEPNGPFRLNGTQNAMLKPDDGDLDPEFVRRRAQVCLAEDPQSPNGALRDLARQSFVDPVKVTAPTLLVMGDRGETTELIQDRLDFYKSLTAKNKWFVMLPGLGKYAPVERGRARFESALLSFLDQP